MSNKCSTLWLSKISKVRISQNANAMTHDRKVLMGSEGDEGLPNQTKRLKQQTEEDKGACYNIFSNRTEKNDCLRRVSGLATLKRDFVLYQLNISKFWRGLLTWPP